MPGRFLIQQPETVYLKFKLAEKKTNDELDK